MPDSFRYVTLEKILRGLCGLNLDQVISDNLGVLETASATKFIEELLVKALGSLLKKISKNDVVEQKRILHYFWKEARAYPTGMKVASIFATKYPKLWKVLGGPVRREEDMVDDVRKLMSKVCSLAYEQVGADQKKQEAELAASLMNESLLAAVNMDVQFSESVSKSGGQEASPPPEA